MRKITFLLLSMLLLVGAKGWAENVYRMTGTKVSELNAGKYVVKAMSSQGTGLVYHTAGVTDRPVRYTLNKDVENGVLIDNNYVWVVTKNESNQITLQNVATDRYFSADTEKNKNMNMNNTPALLTVETHTINGEEYFALTLSDANVGYIHANKASDMDPNLSYWNSYGDDGTCVKFTFYQVEEIPAVDVTYNYTVTGAVKEDGTPLTFQRVVAQIPNSAYAIPECDESLFTDFVMTPESGTATVDAENVVSVSCRLIAPPFELTTIKEGEFAYNTTYYKLNISTNNYGFVVNDNNVVTLAAPDAVSDTELWCFTLGSEHGFKIYNKRTKTALGITEVGNNKVATLGAVCNEWKVCLNGSTVTFPKSEGYSFYQMNGNDYATLNQFGGRNETKLATYQASTSHNDDGSYIMLNNNEVLMDDAAYYRIKNVGSADYMLAEAYRTVSGDYNGYDHNRDVKMGSSVTGYGDLWHFVSQSDGVYKLHWANGVMADANHTPCFYMGSYDNQNLAMPIDVVWSGNIKVLEMGDEQYTILTSGEMLRQSGNGVNVATDDAHDGILWEVEKVESVPVSIGSTGWATLNLPFAVELPAGLKAYYATGLGETPNTIHVKDIQNTVVAAHTPMLLNGAAGNYQLTITTSDDSYTDNLMAGTYMRYVADDGDALETHYGLKMEDGKAVFSLSNSKALPANKAYLPVANLGEEGGQTLSFVFGEFTGINEVELIAKPESRVYYDLSGRRVDNPKHGLYINGLGEKVIIK